MPSEDGRTSTEYIIRVPVFRTGLSVLEVICRILAKYRFEVHVCLDPIKNNLLPAKLNKALYEYIGRKRSSVSSTNESSSNSSSSPPRSFSIPPSRDTTGASVSPAGNDESEFQIFESTRVVDGRQISFIQFNPSNIIEIDDDDYAYYGDLNFLHFNVKSFSSVRRKVSEIYGLPEKNVTIYFYRRKPVLPTFSSELASKEETTASSSGAPGIPGAPQSSPASMPSASELAKSFAPHATVEEAKKNEAAFKNMLTALSQNRRAGGLQNTSIRPDREQ
ncbi:MAG: hypothetical protein NZM05_12465, partial [Chloroherpetonaceae bacterium]|nr:hypothetical protein [Chloroherpetonaceae bacterium]